MAGEVEPDLTIELEGARRDLRKTEAQVRLLGEQMAMVRRRYEAEMGLLRRRLTELIELQGKMQGVFVRQVMASMNSSEN